MLLSMGKQSFYEALVQASKASITYFPPQESDKECKESVSITTAGELKDKKCFKLLTLTHTHTHTQTLTHTPSLTTAGAL